jgi:hypothetical protein
MTHLVLHAMEELDICELVHNKWMYSIKWAMKTFKVYVPNKVRSKASMALGYVYDETIGFVTKYMIEFKHVRH